MCAARRPHRTRAKSAASMGARSGATGTRNRAGALDPPHHMSVPRGGQHVQHGREDRARAERRPATLAQQDRCPGQSPR